MATARNSDTLVGMSKGHGAIERGIMHCVEINSEFLLPLAWVIEHEAEGDPLSPTVKSSFRRAASTLEAQNKIDIYYMRRCIRYDARRGDWVDRRQVLCVCAHGLEITDEVTLLYDVIADGAYHPPGGFDVCRFNWFFGRSVKRLSMDRDENERLLAAAGGTGKLHRLRNPGRWYPELIGVYPDYQ